MSYGFIAQQELTTNTSTSVTFTSIPNTYSDLFLLYRVRAYNGSDNGTPYLRINGLTSSIYNTRLFLNDTAYGVSNNTVANIGQCAGNSSSNSYFGAGEIYFPKYSNTSYNKGYLGFSGHAWQSGVNQRSNTIFSGEVQTTSAITQIEFFGITFGSGSLFTLYGIVDS